MRRGEIWWVNFGPSIGGEIRRQRPAAIVSNDAANQFLNRVQVVPLTGSTDRLYPSEAYVTFRGKKSKAMASRRDRPYLINRPRRRPRSRPRKHKDDHDCGWGVGPLEFPAPV